ncbi:MAG: ABC transporter permease [Bacilli bacterium]|jgi:putative ABC transport system permease protein
MKIIKTLTQRHLKLNKVRTLVIMLGIILVGAMISGVFTLVSSIHHLLIKEQVEIVGNYHALIENIPGERIKDIKENKNIKEIFLNHNLGFTLLEDSPLKEKPYLYIKEYDSNSFDKKIFHLLEGRFPKTKEEIILPEHFLLDLDLGLKIGDKFTLEIGKRSLDDTLLEDNLQYQEKEQLINLETKTYTLVGIMERPYLENYNFPGYTAITYLDFKKDNLYSVYLLAKKPKNIYSIAESLLEEDNNVYYNENLLMLLGASKQQNINKALYSIASILASVIMIGSIGVIYNGFNISLTERKKQFGVLSSVGATRKQIVKSVLYEAFLMGIIAVPLGILSGILGIFVTLKVTNHLLAELDLSFGLSLSFLPILLSFIFIFLTIILSVLIPAFRTAKTSPIEAIRMTDDIKIKSKQVKTSKLTKFIFGIEGEIALKNMKRNKRKYRTTIISLFISIVLFITVHSFVSLGFKSIGLYLDDLNADLQVGFYDVEDQVEVEKIIKRITQIKEIDEYSISRTLTLFINVPAKDFYNTQDKKDNERETVLVQVATFKDPYYKKYVKNTNLKDKEVILMNRGKEIVTNKKKETKVIEYDFLKVKPQDKLILETIEDYEFFEEVTIKKIYNKSPLGYGNYFPLIIVSNQFFEEMLIKYNKPNLSSQSISINSKKDGLVEDKINKITKDFPSINISIYNEAKMKKEERNVMLVFSIFLYGFIGLITLIGVTNVFNTITTNIYLRSKEFAILRCLGLTKQGFNKILYYESILYCLKALFYALPVSILIHRFMLVGINEVFVINTKIPWTSIFITIISLLIIVFSTMIYASRKIKETNIIDAIRRENI